MATDKTTLSTSIRRTASLDALYMRPSWNMAHHLQMQQQLQTQRQVVKYTVLQLDKATQTDGLYDDGGGGGVDLDAIAIEATEFKIGRVMRERLHGHRGVGSGSGSGSVGTATEHSVSSQTLSPVHGKLNRLTRMYCVYTD